MSAMSVLTQPVTVWAKNKRGLTALLEQRACAYCWASFTQERRNQYHCSRACSQRDQAWNAWVRETSAAAISGDVRKPHKLGPAMPPAGRSMFDAIAPFEVPDPNQSELFELADAGSTYVGLVGSLALLSGWLVLGFKAVVAAMAVA